MGGERLQAFADRSSTPRSLSPSFLRPPSVIPAQAGTRAPPTHLHPLSPIHPSPLPGGRLGGGWEVASVRRPLFNTPIALLRHSCAPHRHSCAGRNPRPPPSFLHPIRHSCAGRNPRATHPPSSPHPPSPIHPSPLPGGRLGGGWEVASVHRPLFNTPITLPVTPAPHPVIPAQAGTHAPPTPPRPPTHPFPQFIPPPFQGGG